MLTDLFWKEFVRDNWERQPVCFAGPALITPDEAFHAAVLSSQRFLRTCREHPESEELRPDVRFYRYGAMVTTDLADLLPNTRDVSAESYGHRIEEQLQAAISSWSSINSNRTAETCGYAFGISPDHCMQRRGFLPVAPTPVLFLRNHPTTSFGVHKDRASVFAFLLSGRKKILAWEEHGYRGEPFSSRYSAFLTNAQLLEGNPGDVLYWPSTHWHVGEAEPGFSMSINVGFRYRMSSNWSAQKRIASLVEQCASLEDVQRLCCSGDLDYEMQIWRLIQQTGYGFRAPAHRTGTFASNTWPPRVARPSGHASGDARPSDHHLLQRPRICDGRRFRSRFAARLAQLWRIVSRRRGDRAIVSVDWRTPPETLWLLGHH